MSFVPRCSYRLLLILAYANGLQIWDTSNLGSVKEVLNVNFDLSTLRRLGFVDEEAREREDEEVRVVDAQIVPAPLGKTKDVWEGKRPLLGILLNSTNRQGDTSTTFALYSLKNHRVVEKTELVGVGERVECGSAGFVAVSTTSPASIHILSSTSLETLYTVPSSSLALFAHPPAGHRTSTYLPSTSNLAESILSATQTQPFATPGPVGRTTSATAQGAKKPVFSLSGRLLAFAVPSAANEGVVDKRRGVGGGDVGGGGSGGGVGGEGRGGSPSSVGSGSGFSFGLSNLSNISEIGKNVSELGRNVVQGRIPTSQAELGSAALKVGGSVLSGMRFLGGKAVEAVAKRSVSGGGGFGGGDASPAGSSPVMTSRGVGPGAGGVGAGGVGMGGVGGGRVSRSAPTDLGIGEGLGGQSEEKARRRLSGLSSVSPDSNGFGGGVSPLTKGRVERGSVVRVVDLGTLVDVNANAKKELTAAKSSTTARTSTANKASPTTTNKSSTTTKAPSTTKTPKVVVDFIGSRSQTIAHIAFSTDGGTLFVVPRDGQVTKVFKVVPGPPAPSGVRGARVGEEGVESSTSPGRAQYASQSPPHGQGSYQDRTEGAYQDRPLGTAIHLYDLRRGVSSAVIEDIEVLPDGLLAGVTTRNRTVHVFAPNPFGGRTDVGAHLSGRVRDYVGGLNPPLKVQLSPIVRVRGSRLGNQDGAGDGPREYAPLAFTFVQSNDGVVLPPSLNARPRSLHLDSASSTAPLSSSPSATSYTSNYHLASARHSRPNANHQDTLLFDPVEGTLYLQRITLEARVVKSKEGASFGIAGTSLGSVSTSLTSGFVAGASLTGGFAAGMGMSSLGSRGSVPSAGAAGPLSRSGGGSSGVSASVSERSGVSGASRGAGGGGVRDDQFELVAGVNVVATWNLQRGKEWDEIFVPMHVEREGGRGRGGGGGRGEEWISQAELSTFSPSRAVLPRPIYLSHQFSFHNLGEDYHALIRGYRFDIVGTKIDVRRDVPVQAFSTSISSQGTTDVFLDDFAASSPTSPGGRGAGRMGVVSSFDEPLASALAGEMEGGVVLSESVLPMYPNGVAGSRRGGKIIGIPGIPIKGFGDGVSEGLGRIRRGIRKHGAKIHGRYRDGSATGEGVGAPGEMAFEYDEEEDEEFMAPRIRHSTSSRSHTHTPTNQRSLAGSIHSNMDMDDDVVGHVDEEIWGRVGGISRIGRRLRMRRGLLGFRRLLVCIRDMGVEGMRMRCPRGLGRWGGGVVVWVEAEEGR
ncbi:hypothetical protein CC2G_011214 [Coprinopsis cinerea AmutBmut pab1-1]|nr:hypothetical protein CC2G_011214 [Coprinopsis cinerea AmutBmut pab1-1]